MTSSADDILAGYESLRAGQEALYKDLHEHPELSHHEHRTARCVAGELQKYGFTVQTEIGGTGVVGVLANGAGPAILLRAELDALPIRENTGVDDASVVTVAADGHEVPVAHACGHDMHMSCLLGMAKLLADHRDRWNGTVIPLFQPDEEIGDGAQGMVDDGLLKRIPAPDVALAQHLLPRHRRDRGYVFRAVHVAEDSIEVTVYGRGSHGALPQNGIDPVVIATMIIVRLQTVVSREVTPGEVAIVTVGSVQAGTRSNVIPDHAVLQLNMRSYSQPARQRMLDAIQRIIRAECQASGSPRDPDFETLASFPLLDNDASSRDQVAAAFAAHFGGDALVLDPQTVSEDFGIIPDAAGAPYTYWGIGRTDRNAYQAAEKAGRLADLSSNHSPLARAGRTATDLVSAVEHRIETSMTTELVLLGTAGAPLPVAGRAGISAALVIDGRVFVVDCGRGAPSAFADAGLDFSRLEAVFLTHLHADHVGDLPGMLLYGWGIRVRDGRPLAPIRVYGPSRPQTLPAGDPVVFHRQTTIHPERPAPGTTDLTEHILAGYAYHLNVMPLDAHMPDASALVRATDITVPAPAGDVPHVPAVVFDDGIVKVTAVAVTHGRAVPALAYRFDTPDGSVAFSGDTTVNEGLITLARGADILIHHVADLNYLKRHGTDDAELARMAALHTDVTQVGGVAERARVRELILSHYLPADPAVITEAEWTQRAGYGFSGTTTAGRDGLRRTLRGAVRSS